MTSAVSPMPFQMSVQKTSTLSFSALLKLLELDKSRCSAPELMELLEVPAIQYRFNLTTSDLDILRQLDP